MKYSHLTKILTIKDVEQFVKYIYDELKINFHPDDDFNDFVNVTGEKSFSEADASLCNKLVDDCFNVCEKFNKDFYEITMSQNSLIQQ